jgi:HEAT repeat protein
MQNASDGTYLSKGTDVWVKGLTDKNPVARRLAVYALGEIGPPALSAAPQVRRLLEDDEAFVRVWAANAVAKIEPEKRQDAIATLESGLKDEAGFVRSLSASFLGALGSDLAGVDGVLLALRSCLTDADESVRSEAALAIRKVQGKGNRA